MRENRQLTKAKSAKNDEFYTQYADIQKEVNAYLDYTPDTFRGKTVLLPCDDPEWSKFTRRNGDITCGGLGQTALPGRKRMDHRGPLSIAVTGAWYFITICAEGHLPWQIDAEKLNGDGRAVCPKPPLSVIAPLILREARENHRRGIWKLALMLVMPDHLHFIAHICLNAGGGGLGQTALPHVVAQFKRLLSRRYGLRFQRDFWDTRLRDDAHYAEKFRYVCNNPVRRGLCAAAREWPHVIAFDRTSGEERPHRNNVNEKGTPP